MKIKVSIIIPVFNGEKTLERCVLSIFQQNYHFYEVIVIDDGSIDRTNDICENLSTLYPERFRYKKIANQGVSVARNLGIEIAKGSLIQFVDADDTIDSNYSKYMIEEMRESDLVISGYAITNNKKNVDLVFQKYGNYTKRDFLEKLMKFIYPKNQFFSPCNKLYRVDILKKENIRFQEGKKIGEDCFFNLLYIQKCKSIVVIEECLYFYEKGAPGSAMSEVELEWFESNLEITQTIKNILVNEGIKYENLSSYRDYRDYLAMMYFTRLLTFKKHQGLSNHIQSIYCQLKLFNLWEISNANLEKRSLTIFLLLVQSKRYYLGIIYCLLLRVIVKVKKRELKKKG